MTAPRKLLAALLYLSVSLLLFARGDAASVPFARVQSWASLTAEHATHTLRDDARAATLEVEEEESGAFEESLDDDVLPLVRVSRRVPAASAARLPELTSPTFVRQLIEAPSRIDDLGAHGARGPPARRVSSI